MTREELESKKAEARKRVRELDRADGYADRSTGTIIAALETGLQDPRHGAEFDALVMLEDRLKQESPNTPKLPTKSVFRN